MNKFTRKLFNTAMMGMLLGVPMYAANKANLPNLMQLMHSPTTTAHADAVDGDGYSLQNDDDDLQDSDSDDTGNPYSGGSDDSDSAMSRINTNMNNGYDEDSNQGPQYSDAYNSASGSISNGGTDYDSDSDDQDSDSDDTGNPYSDSNTQSMNNQYSDDNDTFNDGTNYDSDSDDQDSDSDDTGNPYSDSVTPNNNPVQYSDMNGGGGTFTSGTVPSANQNGNSDGLTPIYNIFTGTTTYHVAPGSHDYIGVDGNVHYIDGGSGTTDSDNEYGDASDADNVNNADGLNADYDNENNNTDSDSDSDDNHTNDPGYQNYLGNFSNLDDDNGNIFL